MREQCVTGTVGKLKPTKLINQGLGIVRLLTMKCDMFFSERRYWLEPGTMCCFLTKQYIYLFL